MKRLLHQMSSALALGVIGACIGWLFGMSISPVVQGLVTTLTTLLGVLAAVVAGLPMIGAGGETGGEIVRGARTVRLWPLALLLLGLVLGSTGGVYVRTHELLSPSVTGANLENLPADKPQVQIGGLFSARSDERGELLLKSGADLRAAFATNSNPAIVAAARACTTDTELELLKKIVCHPIP